MSGVAPQSDDGTPDSTSAPDAAPVATDEALRDAAIARLNRKRKFVQDIVGYVAVNGVLWLIWLLSDRSSDGSIPWPAWISLIWGFLLVVDAWRTYGNWPRSLNQPITETDIEREMKRRMA
jgi:hypothetical protein